MFWGYLVGICVDRSKNTLGGWWGCYSEVRNGDWLSTGGKTYSLREEGKEARMVLVAKLWRGCKEGGAKPDGLWNKRPSYIYWSEGERQSFAISGEVWNIRESTLKISKRNWSYDQRPAQNELGKLFFFLKSKLSCLSVRTEGRLMFWSGIWLWQGDFLEGQGRETIEGTRRKLWKRYTLGQACGSWYWG